MTSQQFTADHFDVLWPSLTCPCGDLVLDCFLSCPPDGHSQEAQDAADKAIRAHRKAENAQIRIQDIMDRLPEDKRKVEEIPRDIDDANRDIRKAQTQGSPTLSY